MDWPGWHEGTVSERAKTRLPGLHPALDSGVPDRFDEGRGIRSSSSAFSKTSLDRSPIEDGIYVRTVPRTPDAL